MRRKATRQTWRRMAAAFSKLTTTTVVSRCPGRVTNLIEDRLHVGRGVHRFETERLWDKDFQPPTSPTLLPDSAVDDLGEGAPIGLHDWLERAIGGISDTEKVRDDVVVGNSEDGSGLLLVADRGVAGAYAEVSGGNRHRSSCLPEVVLVDELGAFVGGFGDNQRDGGRGGGDVARSPPHRRKLLELSSIGDDDEVPVLAVRR